MSDISLKIDKLNAKLFARALQRFVSEKGGAATYLSAQQFLAERLGFENHHALGAALKSRGKTLAPPKKNETPPVLGMPSGAIVYLTNGCCEDTGHADEALLQTLGLPWGEFQGAFYPLTADEARWIGEDEAASTTWSFRLGYSVLWQGKKWLAPLMELPYGAGGSELSETEALRIIQARAGALRPAIEDLDGHLHVYPGGEGGDRHEIHVLLPFSVPQCVAEDFEEWKAYLSRLMAEAENAVDFGKGLRGSIRKTVFQITVLTEGEEVYRLDELDGLQDLHYAITEGDAIGSGLKVVETRIMGPEEVRPALLEIGNDGQFFDSWDTEVIFPEEQDKRE